jgi:hypothetical protein
MALLVSSKLPNDIKIATKLIDAEIQSEANKVNVGLLGKLFGGKGFSSINITGLILLILILFLIVFSFFGIETDALTRKDILMFILPAITTIVGYFFGNTRKE